MPNTDDAPFAQRAALFTGLHNAETSQISAALVPALTTAYFQSPRPWLNEGVPQFLATLWTEQAKSREAALSQLDDQRSALALAEPTDAAGRTLPGLLSTSNPVFYRTKAAYVLWMLRSMIGDDALERAFKMYQPASDTTDTYFQKLVETTSGKDLHVFFDDWVYHDRGLPDLSITGVYPSKASADSYLVSVNVTNSGDVGADVPVTVISGTSQATERMYVPANATAAHRILMQERPSRVIVNDGTIPETEASEHLQQIQYKEAQTP
jgi:aminopeptidase N